MKKRKKTQIIVIAGPTSSGKSDMALRLAKWIRSAQAIRKLGYSGAEIISADSRQVYRGMDMGTGKIPRDKMTNDKYLMPNNVRHSSLDIRNSDFYSERVRHWLLDVASPRRQYTAAQWRRDAKRAIKSIAAGDKLPIITGGTGFYIDGLVYGVGFPEVKPDAKLRARLEKKTTPQLMSQLMRRDPYRAKHIDPNNRRRLIRALEIVITTGKPVPRREPSAKSQEYDVLYLAVDMPLSTLRRRIEKRLDARLKGGMAAEVRRIHEDGVSWKRLENFGLEYRWLALFLQKKISRSDMRDALLRDIFAYARRQMTWWRKNEDIHWVSTTRAAKQLTRKFLAE